MMSAPRRGGLDALAEIILDPTQNQRSVVDGVYLSSCQRKGILNGVNRVFELAMVTYQTRETLENVS